MNKLTKLKEIIIEAVPEIVALEFGCELKDKDSELTWIFLSQGESRGFKYSSIWNSVTGSGLGRHEDFEIIGREIRLADVLRAISREKLKKRLDISAFFVYQSGHSLWDLTKNSLDDQSPETIDFLYELLTK